MLLFVVCGLLFGGRCLLCVAGCLMWSVGSLWIVRCAWLSCCCLSGDVDVVNY